MGTGCYDCDGSYVLTDGARDDPRKKQGDGVYVRVYLGEVGGVGI